MKVDEILIAIPSEYANFADVFSLNLVVKLPEHTEIKDYTIELIDSKKQSYRPIYSLKPVELKILKTYIDINLVNSFIRPSSLWQVHLSFVFTNLIVSFICVSITKVKIT